MDGHGRQESQSEQLILGFPAMDLDVSELHRMLADERMRNEEHRRNFAVLRSEHDRLTNEQRSLVARLRQATEEKEELNTNQQTILQQLRKELLAKQNEIEEMKTDRFPIHNLNALKLSIQDEVEKVYRERFALAEEESEQYRSENSKIRYEVAYLKTELEHVQITHGNIEEETRLKYQAQISALEDERASLAAALEEQASSIRADKLHSLSQENGELQRQLHTLKAELDELQASKDEVTSQAESLHRQQVKHVAVSDASLRALELEKSSLQNQLERVQRDVGEYQRREAELSSDGQSLQQKNDDLQSRMRETEYRARSEVSNIRMELSKQKGEAERERDRFAGQMKDLKRQLDLSLKNVESQKLTSAEREKSNDHRLLVMQKEEWNKQHKIETEKLELEARIQELERLRVDSDRDHRAKLAVVEERSAAFFREKENLEGELEKLKNENSVRNLASRELELQRVQLSRSEQEAMQLKEENQRMEKVITDLRGTLTQMEQAVEMAKKESRLVAVDVEREQIERERALIHQQSAWEEQKNQLNNRVCNLESQISQLHSKHYDETQNRQMKLKKYRRAIVKLRNRTQLQKALVDELEMEKEILKKNVPIDVHRNVQKQLRSLQRKHGEFRNVILASDPSATSVVPSETSVRMQKCFQTDDVFNWTKNDQDNFDDQEIEALKTRISILDGKQKEQMMELKNDNSANGAT